MGAEHIRDADTLDRWWDAYQRGEISDGIPADDMNFIQEISAMHAHAVSSASERRVWRQTMAQIATHRDRAVRKPVRYRLPARQSWTPRIGGGWVSSRLQFAAILILTILAAIMITRLAGDNGQPAVINPGEGTPVVTLGTPELTGVPTYRGDNARTGVMPGPGPATAPTVIWQTQLQGAITHQPLLVDGTIYIDDSGGWVYAIDAQTGGVTWQISTGVGGESALTVGDGMVYATTYDGTLLALDATTGQERWRDGRARPRFPAMVIGDRVIFDGVIDPVSGEDGAVFTLNAATGEEIDQFTVVEAFRNLPAIKDGVIYGLVLRGDAYAYDLASHKQLWRVALGSQSIEPITVDGGIAYVPLETSNENGQVVALDAASGEEIWRRGANGNSQLGAAVVNDGTYYACSKDGTLYANNATDGVGQFYESYFDDEWDVVAAPAFADGTVFLGDQGGTLVGTRGLAADRWQVSLPGRIDGGPIVAGELLWVGTYEGMLYALGSAGTPLATPAANTSTVAPATPIATGAQVEWTSQSGLDYPLDVAIDSAGNAYLVDTSNEQVAVIGPDGKLVRRIGTFGDGPGLFHFRDYDAGEHGGVDVGPDDLIYVADGFNNRVQVFDRDYQFLREWGAAGTGEGQFNRATDILVANDQVYVSDFGNNRVQIFTLDGEFVSQFGSFGTAEGEFNGPADLAADGDGNVYVGEWVGARIQRFTPDGTLIDVFVGPGQFVEVWGLDIDPHGNVIAVDGSAAKESLLVFDPQGNLVAEYDTYDTGVSMFPTSLAVGPDGSIYVTDWDGPTQLVKIRIPEVTGSD